MKLSERYLPLVILVVCALIFLPHLGVLPINIMEARNFITAREMIQDQNWILTTFNGEPRYEKPPLPTWITAISAGIFGLENVAALRLPAVFMAFTLAYFTYLLGLRISHAPRYSLHSVLILVTSFYILWAGRNGQWDIFTHGFMMIAIYQFYRLFTEDQKTWQHAILTGIFLGFSFMSKGPVSLYALFLPFLIAFGWTFRFGRRGSGDRTQRTGPVIIMILITLVVSGWWHLYIYFFDTQAAKAITAKEVNNWNSYNVRPFYYYWNFFIQSGTWAIISVVGLIYPYLKDRVFDKRGYQFTLIWTLGAVILLSLIPEKKPRYLLPVLIPLAMNTGFYLEYIITEFRSAKFKIGEKIPVWLQFGLVGIVGICIPFGGYWYLQDLLDGYWIWFILLSVSLFVVGLGIMRALIRSLIGLAFYLTIVFTCALVLFGLPLSEALSDNPQYKSFSQLRHWQDSTGLTVYEFEEASPEMIWDYGTQLPVLADDNTYLFPHDSAFGVLAYEILEKEVRAHFKDYHVQKIGYFDLSPRGRQQGGHKGRLYRDLYLITKEQ